LTATPAEDKHKMGSNIWPLSPAKPGMFLISVSKAPALVWEAQKTGAGKLGQLAIKDPWPYVIHYSFHILDTRNLLFSSGQQMDQVFQALIDRSPSPLDLIAWQRHVRMVTRENITE
jgi:hypothetical protein